MAFFKEAVPISIVYSITTALSSYKIRFSIDESIGVPLFRTNFEKVVRPGVRTPAEDGMMAVSPNQERYWNRIPKNLRPFDEEAAASVLVWMAVIGR